MIRIRKRGGNCKTNFTLGFTIHATHDATAPYKAGLILITEKVLTDSRSAALLMSLIDQSPAVTDGANVTTPIRVAGILLLSGGHRSEIRVRNDLAIEAADASTLQPSRTEQVRPGGPEVRGAGNGTAHPLPVQVLDAGGDDETLRHRLDPFLRHYHGPLHHP